LVGTAVGAAAAIPTTFLGALPILVPVNSHIPDRARIVIDVKLLLAEGKPAMYHSVEPQLSLQ